VTGSDWLQRRLVPPGPVFARAFAILSLGVSIIVGLWFFSQHVTLSGPGDQLTYYRQAARLLPFEDHYYGPGYFVAIRVMRDVFNLEWLTAGKTVGLLSTLGVLAVSAVLFRRVLGTNLGWLALGLLAISPDLIGQMYTDLTIPFGAVWILAAVAVMSSTTVDNYRRWAVAGLLFGMASLVRFQSFAFLLGALVGIAFLRGTWSAKIRAGATLFFLGVLPTAAWKVFLVLYQGAPPVNWNFIALTMGSGEFRGFADVPVLLEKYGSMWGLVRSDPALLVKLVANAIVETIRFPTGVGARMFGPAILWIGPGLIAGLFDRRFWTPWAMALTVGFLVTAPTQPGWTHYFVPMLPLLIVLLVWGAELPDRSVRPAIVAAGWIALIGGMGLWSAYRTPRDFRANEWVEQAVAREYLDRGDPATRLVSSSAATISYNARFRFVDFDSLTMGRNDLNFVRTLRDAGVTHFVVTARHSLFQYPSHSVLLSDSLTIVPDGLVRDTLIREPSRLAVFRVLP
jgi:hypothetical protein